MSKFNKEVAIVTGAAAGIGLGIARRLGLEGAKVLMVDYDATKLQQSMTDLTSEGIDARIEIGDVSDEKVARNSVINAIDHWGRVDILINNAGITGNADEIWKLPVAELDRVYRTNLRGVFCFCKHAIPPMIDQDYGRIVNIASIAGKEGNPKMVPYSATKAAIIGLTKSVGKELAHTGIRVNCVAPAVLQTALLDQLSPDRVDYMLERIPMGRFGKIEELASLVCWLASSECSFSTGAVFDLSGGRATY